MYKDIRKDKANPVLYFKIVKYHKRLVGNSVSLNAWQLMDLVKTEIPIENYKNIIPDDCITYVKIYDFGIRRPFEPTDAQKKSYPWVNLAKSVEKLGLKIPVIAERILGSQGKNGYVGLECKHRLSVFSMLKPFDSDRLVPCLVVEYDPKHTYECHMSGKPHLRKI